jgi:hypothetical protein
LLISALVSIPLKEALKGRTFGLSRHIKNEAGAKKRFMRDLLVATNSERALKNLQALRIAQEASLG